MKNIFFILLAIIILVIAFVIIWAINRRASAVQTRTYTLDTAATVTLPAKFMPYPTVPIAIRLYGGDDYRLPIWRESLTYSFYMDRYQTFETKDIDPVKLEIHLYSKNATTNSHMLRKEDSSLDWDTTVTEPNGDTIDFTSPEQTVYTFSYTPIIIYTAKDKSFDIELSFSNDRKKYTYTEMQAIVEQAAATLVIDPNNFEALMTKQNEQVKKYDDSAAKGIYPGDPRY